MRLLLIMVLIAVAAFADPAAIPISVLGGGAADALHSSSGLKLRGTVGQCIAKRITVDGNSIRSGFWPTMRATLYAPAGRIDELLPMQIEFHAAYPNPFNPSTNISFSLPQSGEVTVELFDITGRLVEVIAKGTFAAGVHQMNWSANELASGNYFARMRAADVTFTQKLVLLK